MKTAFASLLIALSISASSIGFARTTGDKIPFQADITAYPTTLKVDVVVENMEGVPVTIRLVDKLGITQATQRLNKNEKASRTRFDLSALNDGIYRVVVSDGVTTKTQEIHISTN